MNDHDVDLDEHEDLPLSDAVHRTRDAAQVPIRTLDVEHREDIALHLLALDAHDRYLRFGYAAGDEQIRRYVDSLNFERDEVFGIFNRRLHLLGMAHLAYSIEPGCMSCAEFGVSVLKRVRGRGYGGMLFERAVQHARNEGVTMLFVHALSENMAMLSIARKAGAEIEHSGSESQAHLRLPPADFESRVGEAFAEGVARTDYHVKAQAQQFWRLLNMLQSLRWGPR